MENIPVEVDFIINNPEVTANANKVKADIKSVGQTAEETAAKVDSQIKGAFKGAAPGVNETNKALIQQNAIVNKGKPQWNGLGNSINQISREMSAFSVSAQTGFLAISNNIPILADEIGRLSAQNKKLNASGEKTVPVWKQVVKGLLSWQTALSLGVTLLTVYGKDVVNWIGNVFKGKAAIDDFKMSITAVNKAFEGSTYQNAIKDMSELRSMVKLANEGYIDKKVALRKYNETLGDVYKNTNDLAEAERIMVEKAPAYIQAMLFKAAAAEAQSEAAKSIAENNNKIFELEQEKLEIQNRTVKTVAGGYNPNAPGSVNVSSLKADSDLREANAEIEQLDKEVSELQEKSSKVIDNLNKKAAEIAKNAGLNIFGGGEDGGKDKIVSAYQNLLDKLDELDKEYSRKTYTKDEEELQALKDKFSKIRTLVERFNADPKNKAQLIDLTNLDTLETKATESLTYRQTTEKLKTELDEQQKLFNDFETYKAQFGLSAAQKEFEGKIDKVNNYYDYLKQQQKENATAYENVANGTATGGEIERVQFLNAELAKAAAEEKKLFDEQLASLLNYQQKRKKLTEDFNEQYNELVNAGKTEAATELKAIYEQELTDLDDANIKKLASYEALFKGIAGMTTKEVKNVLDNAEQLLNAVGISAELKAEIALKIAEIRKLLSDNKLDAIFTYAGAIGELGDSFQNLGNSINSPGLSDAGAVLSGIAKSAGDVLNIFDTMGEGSFSDLSSGDKANVISAGISGAVTLIGVFANAAQKRKEAEEAYYLSVIGFQNQYNLSLQEQIRLRSILDEGVFLKDYEGRITDAMAALGSANEEYQTALDNLKYNGKAKEGQRNAVDWGNVGTAAGGGAALGATVGSIVPVIGTAVGALVGGLAGAIGGLFATKKKDVYTNIIKEYPELIEDAGNGMERLNVEMAKNLISHDLVNKKTKEMLESLIAQEEQLEESRAQIKEVISELAGSLGTDLKTVLVDAFVAGEDAAIKMGETIEKVLENVLSTLIFNAIFDEAFDKLTEQMSASFDIGGDGTWVDDFGAFFSDAKGLTDDFNAAMAQAQAEAKDFGFDVFQPDDATASTGLTGAIRRELTEETGSELTGLFRGQYDLTKRGLELTEDYYKLEEKHRLNVFEMLALTTKIEQNTANTVEQLKLSVVELKKISKYTKDHYVLDSTT